MMRAIAALLLLGGCATQDQRCGTPVAIANEVLRAGQLPIGTAAVGDRGWVLSTGTGAWSVIELTEDRACVVVSGDLR